ncbi:hypothetical protein KQX62_12840 [Rhodopseudomonas palustris]|uniref:Uncharacterized protein n=1 Tax=Rhodopseudomonas palustris TaxID=1076 RepID=A0AAX3DT70_RHOPL|nr:hypothetical protein [Rhodopseudomonas palustris]UYO37639.1 hypothetical protein KQX62_12840 [Rhodopseudomonas palustris]
MILAWCALAVFFYLVVKYWRSIVAIASVLVVLGIGLGLAFAALVIVVAFVAGIYEQHRIKQCESLPERSARAVVAREDYFGEKLRADVAAEELSCRELAVRITKRGTSDFWTSFVLSLTQ